MKQWVLDTNVVVSGLMNPHGHPALILNAVLDGRVKMACDARILAEYRDVLSRPRLKMAPDKVSAFPAGLRNQAFVTPVSLPAAGPDPDDLIFVEAALATAGKTIVPGNLSHFPPAILHGARVLAPAQAAAEL